ncbi:uncharacterized protein M437DRAFT_61921 [Aureobasidium melanogenum CBS 110374]|uniref:Uncharacterized protein n=1 Tax=Aureobasidium melanogenum (strain CBS 110374) TaxID=1043003 RepID=A0A074WC61_AURM1|nr:uncharacterized protein M437DRAFT_61921 [Aureobasidium melanogenum CBS 110374]KEQ67522.1 hypothetical protein M437DRAFT_61921 [Aureobasidium melanogenum CBS 110374]
MAQNTQQPLMGVRSAQDQLCALASQFTSLAGLGDHSDPELQRYLAIRITDVIRRELVQRGAIQPDQQPTIWEGGPRLDLPEQSAVNTLNPATFEDEEIAIRTEAMPDRSETDEEDIDMSDDADRNYVVGLSQEGFAAKLHKCILDASDNNLKTVEPQFTATLPMVERLGPLMVKALTTYWDKELRQAEAALAATGEPRQALETLGLAEYCRQPGILAERDNAGDFDGAVMSIKDIVQAQEDVTYTRQGMKSWVWPLLQKYCMNTDQSKEVEIGNEELLYMALGEKFPKSYGEYKFSRQDIESHGLVYERPEKETKDKYAPSKWRGRRRNYYRCLSWLRTEGHSWVFMVNVRNLDSLFGQISDPEATFGPWIEFFGSFPAELSLRAFSRANGDYSGRREMRLFKNVPQAVRDEWNDNRVVWKHFTELVAFQSNTEVMADMEKRAFIDLPSMEETLKYGYCGFRDDNYSWSITIRDDEKGGLGAFSTVPIKAGSFIGFLPGYCRFSPEKENRMEVEGFIESHLLGLLFEDQGCCGLLSYMKRTNFGAEGNVIGGWEQFNDDMGQNSIPWCIVVFAYRDIPALTPLVFWDHMRFD